VNKRQAAKVAHALGNVTGKRRYYAMRDYLLGRAYWPFPNRVGADDEKRFMEWVQQNSVKAWALYRSMDNEPGWSGNYYR